MTSPANDFVLAGHDERERLVYLSFCSSFAQILEVRPPARPFIVLLGGNTTNEAVDDMARVAEHLLSVGAVYLVCWGAGASRLEDIVDEVAVEWDADTLIMTTAHEDESLFEALEFCIDSAVPADPVHDCRTIVMLFFGNVNWHNEAAGWLEDHSIDESHAYWPRDRDRVLRSADRRRIRDEGRIPP